jgi:hypothetical protein
MISFVEGRLKKIMIQSTDLFWIQDSPAKTLFIERFNKSSNDELLRKMIMCSQIIDEYWDLEYFTKKELSEQLVCVCERDVLEYHEGILVKKEPDENKYTITVSGLIDFSTSFSLSKTYNSFPTSKNNIIGDFISLDLLEKQTPIDYIGNSPIYLTAYEYFYYEKEI